MKPNKTHNFPGIYCIINLINEKKYIGKSKNIYLRIQNHIYTLNNKSKDENRHLIGAWHKYGKENFSYFVVEQLELDPILIAEREYFWQNSYNVYDRNYGYNLRRDCNSQMIVNEETKKLISKNNLGKNNPNYGNKWTEKQKNHLSCLRKQMFQSGKLVMSDKTKKKIGENSTLFWKNNPDKIEIMAKKVKKTKQQKHSFLQKNENGDILKIWNTIDDILKENPTYKWQNIYSVCNGYKKRIYGFKWEKIEKLKFNELHNN